MSGNNNAQKGARKSLFSIQVDDLIIQRIFKTLEDEICKMRVEITEIHADVSEKSNKNDLIALKSDVREFRENFDLFKDKIESDLLNYESDLKMTVNEMKTFVRDQIAEATFSINNVVRAQNALIEEKIFQLSQPNEDVNHVLVDVERLKQSSSNLSSKLRTIENFFSTFLNNTDDSEKTLPQLISYYFEPEREKIRNIEQHQKRSDNRIQECEENIHNIIGSDEIVFPPYGKAEKHPFHIKPKFPPFPTPNSYTDYFKYMMTVFPLLQKILSSFYHQIVGLSNTVYDQTERHATQEDLERSLQELTDMIADVRELKENNSRIDSLSTKVEDIISNQPKISDMLNEFRQFKEATMSRNEINEEIKKSVSGIVQEIQLLKMGNSFKSESRRIPNPSTPLQKRFSTSSLKVFNKNNVPIIKSSLSNNDQEQDLQMQEPKQQQQPDQQLYPPQQQDPQPQQEQEQAGPSSSRSSKDDTKKDLDASASPETTNVNTKNGASSAINSPGGSASNRHKGSSANPSPRIMKPELHVQSSAASTVSVPDPVIAAVQPRGRASYRMIFGDGSSSRPSSAVSVSSYSSSRIANLSVQRPSDIEEGGREPKRTQKTANPVQISTDGLPEEKDDSLDFLNIL